MEFKKTFPIPLFLKAALLALLLAACGRAGQPSASPAPTAAGTTPDAITPTSESGLPTPPPWDDSQLSLTADFPYDLAPIGPDNFSQLAPFRQLSTEDLPQTVSSASLAYFASYEHALAAYLDGGQLISWDMVLGEVQDAERIQAEQITPGFQAVMAVYPGYPRLIAVSTTAPSLVSGEPAAAVAIYRQDSDDGPNLLPGIISSEDDAAGVTGLAFSPDGTLLAVARSLGDGAYGLVRIWRLDQQVILHELETAQPVHALSFSQDGRELTFAVGEQLITLDPDSGEEISRQDADLPMIGYQDSSRRGISLAWNESLAVLYAPGLQALQVQPLDRFQGATISPDEPLALLADGDLLRAIDLRDGKELATLRGPARFLALRMFDNGRILATIDEQARLLLWGVRGGIHLPERPAWISVGNAGELEKAAGLYLPGGYETLISPNSDWVAIASPQGVYLLDLPSLKLRRLLPQEGLDFIPISASADGRWLAWVEREAVVSVWDLATDTLAHQITGLGERCCQEIHLSPNGDALAVIDDRTARLWDLTSGQEIYSREAVQQVEFSPDGSRLALTSGRGLKVTLWDRTTGQELLDLTGFTTAAPVYYTSFSPDWTTMYWASRASMQFSDVQSGALGPSVPFSWGVFAPSGDRVAAVEDGWIMETVGEAYLIDVHSGNTLAVFDHREDAIIDAAAISPDGRLLATATELTLKIFDAERATLLYLRPHDGDPITGLWFSPDGRILVLRTGEREFEFWIVPGASLSGAAPIEPDTADSVEALNLLRLGEPATEVVFSADGGTVAASTGSGRLWYWDLASDEAIQDTALHSDWIYRLAYNPIGGELASASKDGSLRLWSGPGAPAGLGDPEAGELSSLVFASDGRSLVTSGQDGSLRTWEVPGLRLTGEIEAHGAWVWDLAMSPSGDLLASGSADRSIKLWSIETDSAGAPQLNLLRTLSGHTAAVWALDFAPDGRRLASASWDGTVRLWDPESGETTAVLQGHTDWLYAVDFSPDGRLIASASADGTVRLWDSSRGELLTTLSGLGDRIWSVAFSPDGRALVSASDGGLVQIWGIRP